MSRIFFAWIGLALALLFAGDLGAQAQRVKPVQEAQAQPETPPPEPLPQPTRPPVVQQPPSSGPTAVRIVDTPLQVQVIEGPKTEAQYAAEQGAGRGFQFVFARQIDGKPIVDPLKDKSFKLEFNYPIIKIKDGTGKDNDMGDGRALMEFKVDKMVVNGNIAF